MSDEPFDVDAVDWTREDDVRQGLDVFRHYFPGPGNWHCLKCQKAVLFSLLDPDKGTNCDLDEDDDGQPPNGDNAEELNNNSHHDANDDYQMPIFHKPEEVVQQRKQKTRGKKKSDDQSPIPKTPVEMVQAKPKTTKEKKSNRKQPEPIVNYSAAKQQPKQKKSLDQPPVAEKAKEPVQRKRKNKIETKIGPEEVIDDDYEPPIAETAEEMIQRPKVSDNQKVWLPFTQTGNMFKDGLRSQFTIDEHGQFVGMMAQIQNRGKFNFQGDLKAFEAMKRKLEYESVKYNDYVKQKSDQTLVNANKSIPKKAQDYVAKCMQNKVQMLRSWPKKYSLSFVQYLTLPMSDMPVLEFRQNLVTTGEMPKIVPPDMTRKVTVPVDNSAEIDAKFPLKDKALGGLLDTDLNVPSLISKYEPDVVAATSALRCLVLCRGPMLSDECDFPIVMQNQRLNGRMQNVIFINKPIPPVNQTKRQQFGYIAKLALKSKIVQLRQETRTSDSYSGPSYTSNFDQDYSRGALTDADSDYDEPSTPKRMRHASSQQRSASPEPVRAKKKSVLKKRPVASKRKAGADVGGGDDIVSGIMAGMDRNLPKKMVSFMATRIEHSDKGSRPLENSSEFVNFKGGCQQYLLWALSDFKILTRSNIYGYCQSPTDVATPAVITAKVEYQPGYGAEMQTDEELVHDWLTAFLKQASRHIRGRVKCEAEYDLLAFETSKKTPGGLEEAANLELSCEQMQIVSNGMRRLHAILTRLKQLDQGHYILRTNASEPYKVMIYQNNMAYVQADPRVSAAMPTMDLNTYMIPGWIRVVEPKLKPVDYWRKIDSQVLFRWHVVMKRIPTSFHPRKDNEKPRLDWAKKGRKKQAASGKKKKTRRGKNKKQMKQKQPEETADNTGDDSVDEWLDDVYNEPIL